MTILMSFWILSIAKFTCKKYTEGSMSLTHDNIIEVVIYRLSSIGDVVLATACLDLLKCASLKASSNSSASTSVKFKATFIGRSPALDLIKNTYPDVTTVELPKPLNRAKQLDIIDKIKSVHLVIDLQTNLKSFLFCRALAKKRGSLVFRAKKEGGRRLRLVLMARLRGRLADISNSPKSLKKIEKRQYQMMLDPLIKGIQSIVKTAVPREAVPHLPLERETALNALNKFNNKIDLTPSSISWLSVAVGASHETKRAPTDIFINILKALNNSLEKQRAENLTHLPQLPGLIFLGDQNDIVIGDQVIQQLEKELHWPSPMINFTGQCTLFETAALLKLSDALLSNDSSLGHIAEAVDTPTAILFGPTIETFGFAPRMTNINGSRESKAFSSPLGCRPCSRHGKKTCRYGDQKCFYDIDVDKVALHLIKLLKNKT